MGIAVALKARDEFPVACMPSETQQIFANFIANSIEAMHKGGRIVIRIRSSRDWRNPQVRGMRVTICDNGTGIDSASLKHIFEPFFTTKTDTGTGLGLWVVAELVDRHKGSVHVRSSQKAGASGTAFSIFLPKENLGARQDVARQVETPFSKSTADEVLDNVTGMVVEPQRV
jgi:two-component system CheB/CheR fusion protein